MTTHERIRAWLAWTLGLAAPVAMAILFASLWWDPAAVEAGAPLLTLGLEPTTCSGCSACGLSRAFSAMSHLRFSEAVAWSSGVLVHSPLAWLTAFVGPPLLIQRLRRKRTCRTPHSP